MCMVNLDASVVMNTLKRPSIVYFALVNLQLKSILIFAKVQVSLLMPHTTTNMFMHLWQ